MNWLFNALEMKLPSLREPLVDCNNCQLKSPLKRVGNYSVDSKCCEFSPYWSCFAIGAWLEKGHNFESLISLKDDSMIISRIGIMHSVEHRLGKESLCNHFSKDSNNCSIWSERPPTCFTFFCASEYKKGIEQYSLLEDWLLSIEAAALKLYFSKVGIAPGVWSQWADYMEEEPGLFPEELLLDDPVKAETLYRESYQWLKTSAECESLLFDVKVSWARQFSFNPIYGKS